jgi:hypothetical protein
LFYKPLDKQVVLANPERMKQEKEQKKTNGSATRGHRHCGPHAKVQR